MTWSRVLLAALALFLYVRSPIDLVPDRFGPIGLLDDLIILMIALWWLRRRMRAARAARVRHEPPPATAGTTWNPYVVLGVGSEASADEISRAYREQMKRYHPDRVADLGAELQQLAHQKTIEIQRAYREIAIGARPSRAEEPLGRAAAPRSSSEAR